MNFNKILEELKLIADRINSISIRSSGDYPLIPSNIVAIKKVDSLERDLISLRAKNEILQSENDRLLYSTQKIFNEVSSIPFINKRESYNQSLIEEEVSNPEDDFPKENCIIQHNIPEESK